MNERAAALSRKTARPAAASVSPGLLMRRPTQPLRGGGMEVPPVVQEVMRSPGRPLDAATRGFMEPRFGHDFSRVRVHDDVQAARSANAVSAEAYTVGHELVFGAGRYAPDSPSGRGLLAHELAHVVQQGQGSTAALGPIRLDADPRHEAAADRAASAVVGGQGPERGAGNLSRSVQRKPAESNAPAAGPPQDAREQIITLAESDKAEDRQQALDLILSNYFQRPENFGGIVYDPDLKSKSPQDAETGPKQGQPQFGGDMWITIGPRFFRQFRSRYDQRVRTIGHELQHVGQRSPPGGRTVGSTFGGIGLGAAIGGLLGLAGIGIAAAAGASLNPGLVGGVIGGSAAIGGLIGGSADPFGGAEEPVRNRNTREFLAIHWVVTAQVSGLKPLPPGQILQNINQPKEGALDRYKNMPPEDQKKYRRQYDEILEIKQRLELKQEREKSAGDLLGPEPPVSASDAEVA